MDRAGPPKPPVIYENEMRQQLGAIKMLGGLGGMASFHPIFLVLPYPYPGAPPTYRGRNSHIAVPLPSIESMRTCPPDCRANP